MAGENNLEILGIMSIIDSFRSLMRFVIGEKATMNLEAVSKLTNESRTFQKRSGTFQREARLKLTKGLESFRSF